MASRPALEWSEMPICKIGNRLVPVLQGLGTLDGMSETRTSNQANHPLLTERQQEAVSLLARGYTNPQIAEALGISLEGAKYLVREVMARLDAGSREEAVEVWKSQRRSKRSLRTAAVATAILIGGASAVVAATVLIIGVLRDGTGSGEVPDSSATSTPVPSSPASEPLFYPLGTRTGIVAIDGVLEALEAQDGPALISRLEFFSRPCTGPAGAGTVPCPSGAQVGAQVSVVGWTAAEGIFVQEGDLEGINGLILRLTDPRARMDPRMYAVSYQRPLLDDASIPGRYLIVLASGTAIAVNDTGITFVMFPRAGEPLSRWLEASPKFLLPPK